MDDPRRAAAAALMKQEKNGYANLILRHAQERFLGSARDRAFFSAIFYGTVERLVTIDYLLQKFLTKPLSGLDAAVRAVLRSGLYQARWMDGVPVRAAVSESVALTRRMGKSSAAGLVNAVLRRAAACALDAERWPDETARLSVTYSVSPQIAALLREKCPDQCEAVLRASFAPPPLCVRVNTLKTDAAALARELARQGAAVESGRVPDSLYVGWKGDLTALPLFAQGLFQVQGEASQLACAALDARPGEKVLDLCAAPGGKSAVLAQYMRNTGTLFSCDAARSRLPLIESTFARLGVCCGQVAHGDAAAYRPELAGADAVLCDVPCSGLGVLAKKPDIRLKTLEGLPALIAVQRAILETASRYVRPGGRLVYSTCTLNPDENGGVVRAFLREHPEFERRSGALSFPGMREEDGLYTLYPHLTGTDGFFIAPLVRR